jgi:hypothetical protein
MALGAVDVHAVQNQYKASIKFNQEGSAIVSPIKKLLCCLAVGLLAQSAQAAPSPATPTVPFNNLNLANQIFAWETVAGKPFSNSFGPYIAAAATSVGSSPMTITNFVVNVYAEDTSVPLVAQVCADNAGIPNLSVCQAFTTATNPIPVAATNVGYTGTYNAAANAIVWIVLTSSGAGRYGWSVSTAQNYNWLASFNGGGNWQKNSACCTLIYSISGTPVGGPTASAVTITGTPQVGSILTGSYTYNNTSGAAQGNTTMRWMSGTQADGSDKRSISGANAATYSPAAADGGNYLFYCVTPVAQTGTFGAEVCSSGSQFVLVSNITTPTTVTGVGPNQVAPLDLSTGYGPTLTQCLMATIRQLLGQDAVYLGQVSGGSTRVQQGGKVISFYVVRAGGDASQGSGLQLLQSNAMTVGTSCGNLSVTPALYNPTELGAALTAAGLTASINAQGVITIGGNGSVYVARPDYFVTPGQAAGPSLKQGADGQYRFTDSAGNSQVLRAAFLSPDTLQADAGAALGGNLVIQIDGTALFSQFNGTQSVLSPDLLLGGIPASSATATWWTDGPNHYRFPIGFASQGLTQTAK